MDYDQQIRDADRFSQERAGGSSLGGPRLGVGVGPSFEQALEDTGEAAQFIKPLQKTSSGTVKIYFTLDVDALDGPAVLA